MKRWLHPQTQVHQREETVWRQAEDHILSRFDTQTSWTTLQCHLVSTVLRSPKKKSLQLPSKHNIWKTITSVSSKVWSFLSCPNNNFLNSPKFAKAYVFFRLVLLRKLFFETSNSYIRDKYFSNLGSTPMR